MFRRPRLALILLTTITLSSSVSFALPKSSSLPGGLLYPQFATSGITNAAALTYEPYSEIQALYSPGLSDQSPAHSYLIGYGTSDSKYGLNMGYSGSIQSGVMAHNLFLGISRRFEKHSFGFSVRKNDLVFSNETPVDLSWIWTLSKSVSMGLVSYDIFENKALAVGFGYQDLNHNSLDIDLQFPLPGYPNLKTREYSVNFASVVSLNDTFAVSLGTRYQRWISHGTDSSTFRFNLGTLIKLNGQLSVLGLYTSSPNTITAGLSWGTPSNIRNFAPSQR